jgi:hypothetical protein
LTFGNEVTPEQNNEAGFLPAFFMKPFLAVYL